MNTIMIPIKKNLLTEFTKRSISLKGDILTPKQLDYLREETLSNFEFLGDYIKNLIDRFERMENDSSTVYIANTCKDYERLSDVVERINAAFQHLKIHVASQVEKESG